MDLSAFDFDLPASAIAQEPCEPRDEARMLVAGCAGPPSDRQVRDLPSLLEPGDVVVVNDTRVIPARLELARASGGRVECLLLERIDTKQWWCMLRSSAKLGTGERLAGAGGLVVEILERSADRSRVRITGEGRGPEGLIERVGRVPLPPYVRRRPDDPREARDRVWYQTMFAHHDGSVAAPTAGLHFTPRVVVGLEQAGVHVAKITLHVGPGTFRPVRASRIEEHSMHAESFELPETTAREISGARERGSRVVAVGTTVVRTLEHCGSDGGRVAAGRGRTELFIRPGYRFRVVDAMLTNFHLPCSTLFILVAAFVGLDRAHELYRVALDRSYRFYSYGDAMLLEEHG